MKKMQVQINPYLEFMNSILLTSRYNEMTEAYIGYGLMTTEVNDYTSGIKQLFAKYSNAPIYPFIEELIPNGFSFGRPVEMMLCVKDKDFALKYEPSQLCIEYCGGRTKINELLGILKGFAHETNYFTYFEKAKEYYAPFIKKAEEIVNQYPYTSILEAEYGVEQNAYYYILSGLMNGNYGISFAVENKTGKDLYSVFATGDFSISPAILFHEYSHPFINPLTEKYEKLVRKYESAHELLTKYKLPGFLSGYGDWLECVNEHFVRSMVIHLLKKCSLQETAEEMLEYDLQKGYRYIPLILERYKYYDENRNIFKNFDMLYPELLKVFEDNCE
ncbi:MAG: DUF4932 domain-containing protein [Lachnospiraceae bacterium]|nr:DUF4932 domain-containing protein [Lachnospiraceae bacterium]